MAQSSVPAGNEVIPRSVPSSPCPARQAGPTRRDLLLSRRANGGILAGALAGETGPAGGCEDRACPLAPQPPFFCA